MSDPTCTFSGPGTAYLPPPGPSPTLPRECAVCHSVTRLRCRCRQVRYCSAACQKAAWPVHKLSCPARPSAQQAREDEPL